MSKAREIAEERLAKGEISPEEFETIVKRLEDTNTKEDANRKINEPVPAQQTAPTQQDTDFDFSFLKWPAIYLAACTVFYVGLGKSAIEESIIEGCGNTDRCICGAEAVSERYNFFLAPLQTFGLAIDKSFPTKCGPRN